MKFSQILAFSVPLVAAATNSSYKYERLDKEKAGLLVVDHQVGLFHLVRDMTAVEFHNALLAHAALAEVFELPIVLTTSAEKGPNGPLPKELIAMHPDAPIIARNGEVNAWDDPNFREAVYALNRTQLIIAGITTDVCTAFLAQSLREAGFSVWANADASGTTSVLARELANDVMKDAGVHIVTLWAIVGELMRDWKNTPGAKEMFPWLNRYFPVGGYLFRSHAAAVTSGELQEGTEELI